MWEIKSILTMTPCLIKVENHNLITFLCSFYAGDTTHLCMNKQCHKLQVILFISYFKDMDTTSQSNKYHAEQCSVSYTSVLMITGDN